MDEHDQDLMESFKALGPLLMQASRYTRESDEERVAKRAKPNGHSARDQETGHNQQSHKALLAMTKAMASLLLQHERSIQHMHRQDSYIIFAQVGAAGSIPLLTKMAAEWKELRQSQSEHHPIPTLRTHLLRGLFREVHSRALKLSKSKPGEEVWDTAQNKGVLLPDGQWPKQRWCHQTTKLVHTAQPPVPMQRMLHQLSHAVELLEDCSHVIRFHSLKPGQTIVPWYLQVSLRESDLWYILQELQTTTIWGLMGLSIKNHSQPLSKPAIALQQLLHPTTQTSKGKGKGKTKSKPVKAETAALGL